MCSAARNHQELIQFHVVFSSSVLLQQLLKPIVHLAERKYFFFRIFLEYLFYCHCATWNGIILHPIRREHVHCLVHFMQNYIFATFMQICRIMDVYFIMLPKYFGRFLPPRPWYVPLRIWCQFLRHHLYQFCCKFPKIKDKVLKLKNLWETGNWGKVESF